MVFTFPIRDIALKCAGGTTPPPLPNSQMYGIFLINVHNSPAPTSLHNWEISINMI